METQPDETMAEAIAARRSGRPNVVIDYGLHMTIGPATWPSWTRCQKAFAAGCTSFKLYMAYGLRLRDDELLRALTAVRNVSGIPVVHTENWDVITELIRQGVARRAQSALAPAQPPALLEAKRPVGSSTLPALSACRCIFHISCGETVARIAQARQQGLPVTGETCPQYLFLTWDAYDAPAWTATLPSAPRLFATSPRKPRCGRRSAATICKLSPPTTARSPTKKKQQG
ncbi:MAG: hypothetical protein R3D55_03455 [Chloroflexota bacterium]